MMLTTEEVRLWDQAVEQAEQVPGTEPVTVPAHVVLAIDDARSLSGRCEAPIGFAVAYGLVIGLLLGLMGGVWFGRSM